MDGTTTWTGWDPRGGASARPDAAEVFTHASPGGPEAEDRYELIAVAAREFRPPRFLSVVLGEAERTFEEFSRTWSLQYEQVAETGPRAARPFAIYLLGVNPPVQATQEDLVTFNDFYTNVHLPEVAERRRAIRATRHELRREIRPPYNGAPRFLAVYEVDEASASNRRHKGPPYTTGPEVWQGHATPWRLWYRLLAPAGEAASP